MSYVFPETVILTQIIPLVIVCITIVLIINVIVKARSRKGMRKTEAQSSDFLNRTDENIDEINKRVENLEAIIFDMEKRRV